MAIHVHSINQPAPAPPPAPDKATVFHGFTAVASTAKTSSKVETNFSAMLTESTRQPTITVTSPATTSPEAASSSSTSASSTNTAASSSTSTSSSKSTESTSSSATASNNTMGATPVDTDSSDWPAGPMFGPNPWVADPTGSGPGPTTHYSSFYFATPQTAQTVANMLGGTVVSANEMVTAPGSPFTQDQPNLMVQLPNGGLVNPGLIATLFTHNWPMSFVNQQIANEVAGALPANSSS